MLGLSIRILACLLVVGLFVAHHGNAEGAVCKDGSVSYKLNETWRIKASGIPYRCKCERKKNNPRKLAVYCRVRACLSGAKLYPPNSVVKKCRCVERAGGFAWKCT